MKMASALLKSDRIFIQSYSTTNLGAWVASGRVYSSKADDTQRLALNIRLALEESGEGRRHPERGEWAEIQKPMLDAVGAKSWSALAKGAKAVGIELQDGLVKITPSEGYENEGGESVENLAVVVDIGNDGLGRVLVDVFDRSS